MDRLRIFGLHRLRWLVVVALLVAATAVPARADHGDETGGTGATGDNLALAINDTDGFDLFELAFDIHRVHGDVVGSTNAAVAYATCVDCRTVAIAIQIILVFSQPSIVTPNNIAVAINEGCVACVTVALAYQFVVSVPDGFHFSGAAQSELAAIRKLLRELEAEELAPEELRARVGVLMDRVRAILEEELVRAADEDRRERDEDEEDDGEDDVTDQEDEVEQEPSPTPTPSGSEATSPTPGSPSPSPSPSGT